MSRSASMTGEEAKTPVFVLAGYVVRARKWKAFSHGWQALVRKYVLE